MRGITWFVGLVIASQGMSQSVGVEPRSYNALESYGDSLTAGFLSETAVTQPPPLKAISTIISDLATYLLTGNKTQLQKYERRDLAWPTVIAKALSPSSPLLVRNHAVSGARVAELLSQVQGQPVTSDPTVAFFLMGHNDFCNTSSTPDELSSHFEMQLEKAVAEWDQRHSQSVAYFLALGDIYRVLNTLKGYVWHQGNEKKYACEDSWEKFFPYCPSYSRKLKEGTLEAYMTPLRQAADRATERIAQRFAQSSQRNRYVYLANVLNKPYQPEYFAVDCYHLSALGQAAVAKDIIGELARLPESVSW